MQKEYKYIPSSKSKEIDKSDNIKIGRNFKKVDINILLNRVKINKKKETKKNIISISCMLITIGFSAYVIFN